MMMNRTTKVVVAAVAGFAAGILLAPKAAKTHARI